MRKGDMRRFLPEIRAGSVHTQRVAGQTFVVLDASSDSAWVSFLIEDRVERGWGYEWVELNSEVVSESQ